MLVVSVPYLLAVWWTPVGQVYTGLHALAPVDNSVYYSYIQQIADGNFLIRDLYTSEPQSLGVFNLAWWLVGTIAKIFSLTPPLAYHLARILLVPFLTLSVWLFVSLSFTDSRRRRTAFALATFAAGWGIWLVGLLPVATYSGEGAFHTSPIDVWLTHPFVFHTALQSPHNVLSLGLQIFGLLFTLMAFKSGKVKYGVVAGLAFAAWLNFHPYFAPFLGAVLLLFTVWTAMFEYKKLGRVVGLSALIGAMSAASVFYHLSLLKDSPLLATRGAQNITLLPSPIYWFFGLGFVAILAVYGVYIWLRKYNIKLDQTKLMVMAWVAASLILAVYPSQFQARYLQGIMIPLAVLATVGLTPLVDRWRAKIKRFDFKIVAPILFVLLFVGTNFFVVGRDLIIFKKYPHYVYQPKEFVEAAIWVKENISNVGEEAIILTRSTDGLFLVGYAARKVWVGHPHETLDFKRKEAVTEKFFGDQDFSDRKEFLEKENVNYIFTTDKEIDWEVFEYLEQAYSNELVKIYQVEE